MSNNPNEVVPWGRSLAEYRDMFNLSDADLNRRILGCGDGPASFNVEMKQLGHRVVSIDPIYTMSRAEIEARIEEVYHLVVNHCRMNEKKFVWSRFRDAEAMGQARLAAMGKFLPDLAPGLEEGRYQAESLPKLSFADGAFDLALSSHFLFLYADWLDLDFHLDSIKEMCRVAGEARFFPLNNLNRREDSPHLKPVMKRLRAEGWHVRVEKTGYEFQKGANRMLRVSKKPLPGGAPGWRRWLGL